jgi:hypothetical protein
MPVASADDEFVCSRLNDHQLETKSPPFTFIFFPDPSRNSDSLFFFKLQTTVIRRLSLSLVSWQGDKNVQLNFPCRHQQTTTKKKKRESLTFGDKDNEKRRKGDDEE